MDRYEHSLLNHILMSASHRPDGGTTYFMPLRPGGRKEYSTEENTCCHGTGMESRFRYVNHIYAFDGDVLYLNLYVPSALNEEVKAELRQEAEGVFLLKMNSQHKGEISARIPGWTGKDFRITVNGEARPYRKEAGYAVIPGGFGPGDEIRVAMTYSLRRISAGFGKVSLAYGPYLLAAVSDREEYIRAPLPEEVRRTEDGGFAAKGLKMIPACRVDEEAYHLIMER